MCRDVFLLFDTLPIPFRGQGGFSGRLAHLILIRMPYIFSGLHSWLVNWQPAAPSTMERDFLHHVHMPALLPIIPSTASAEQRGRVGR